MTSLIHWFIGSSAHLFIDSFICTRILSCHFVGISTTISSFVDAPHNFNPSWSLHLKNVPIGHVLFSKLPPRRVPGTISGIKEKALLAYDTPSVSCTWAATGGTTPWHDAIDWTKTKGLRSIWNYQPESICVYSICLPTNFAKLGSYRYWIPTEYPYISEFPSLSRRSLNFLSSLWCQRGIETEIVASQGKFLTIKLTCSGCSRLHCLEIII